MFFSSFLGIFTKSDKLLGSKTIAINSKIQKLYRPDPL